MILQGEPLRLGKGLSCAYGVTHPSQNEGSHFTTVDVMAKAVPLVLNAGQMVGLDRPFFEGGRVKLLVLESQHHAFPHRFADHLKRFQVSGDNLEATKRNERIEVVPRKSDFAIKPGNQFIESTA